MPPEMLTDELVDSIRSAVNILKEGAIKRVEGHDFAAYKVGTVIRVDIKQKEK